MGFDGYFPGRTLFLSGLQDVRCAIAETLTVISCKESVTLMMG